MNQELTKFFIEQFDKVATKYDIAIMRSEMATKDDIAIMRSEMATKDELGKVKAEVLEVKSIVKRLDRRTDEDIRATMKDVDKIKTFLDNHGHQI